MDLRAAFLVFLALATLVGCGKKEEPVKPYFVHATDMHLFAPLSEGNQKSATDLFDYLRTPATSDAPQFLALTGDFGVGQNEALHKDEVERLARLFAASPVKEIYLVAGEADVAQGSGDDAALQGFAHLLDEVQAKIGSRVEIHNLLSCYVAPPNETAGCYADVKGTAYRLIGFPAFGFRNPKHGAVIFGDFDRRLEKLKLLLDEAQQANKKVLLLAHTPEIDDPARLAKFRLAAKGAADSTLSMWDVDRHVLDEWRPLLAHPALSAVLAGHVEDSHREIYREPYTWSTPADYRFGFTKLLIAPPLGRNGEAENSPIEARGFARVTLGDDKVTRQLYWYDPLKASFALEGGHEGAVKVAEQPAAWWNPLAATRWIWQQGPTSPLEKLEVLAIAFITAFLTIVALWQIPPPEAGTAAATTTPASFTPFSGRYGQTVLAGLGGLLVAEIAKIIGSQTPSPESRGFYIVWFIYFFFLLLFALNVIRAFWEAVRFMLYSSVKSRLITSWSAGVVFTDSLFNLIQGKNQTRTRLVEDAIIKQQASLTQGMITLRKDLAESIRRQLEALKAGRDELKDADSEVYVSATLLTRDRTELYYISQNPGPDSLAKNFTKTSLAWIAVMAAEPRWYKAGFDATMQLLDNTSGKYTALPPKTTYKLGDYFQDRAKAPYKAFLILPFPGGTREGPARGAIHIAFRSERCFDLIWKDKDKANDFSGADELFDKLLKKDFVDQLKFCLTLFDELGAGINETVFRSRLSQPAKLSDD